MGGSPGLDVTVTLLFSADCPNWQLADERLREALVRAAETAYPWSAA